MKPTIQIRKAARSIAMALAICASCNTSGADTITLTSGTQFEGKLISQNAEEVVFEVGISVKEVRTFKRSEVSSIDVVSPDEIAFESLEDLVPTPDLLEENDYLRLIKLPQSFLSSYPTSPLKPQVTEIVTTLEAEMAKVVAGGVKIGGTWITAEQIEADPYNHAGLVALTKIKQLVAEKSLLSALREFDSMEQSLAESTSYPAAVATIKEALPIHSERLSAQLKKTLQEDIERKEGFESMRFAEREKAENAYRRELEPFQRRHAAAKESGEKWLDFHIWDAGSIKDAQKEADDEIKRLERLNLADLASKAKTLKDISAALEQENFMTASDLLSDYGSTKAGTRAAQLREQVSEGIKKRKQEEANAAALAEIERAQASDSSAETETEGSPEPTTSEPEPESEPEIASAPRGSGSSSGSADPFDDSEDEAAEPESSGLRLTTVLMIIIPIMAIVTLLSLLAAKKNQVEDFVPDEPEEPEES